MKTIKLDIIDSTNTYLKENRSIFEDFTFVRANFQSSGKGREDRKWISPKNENLLFSILIKDKNVIKNFKALSIATATLIARFLEILGLENVMVKWPNDVYANGKKICGVLLEGNVKQYIVIGVGLNVNQKQFLGDYKITPTSISNELSKDLDINKLSFNLFKFLDKHLHQKLLARNTLRFYKKHDYFLGKFVETKNGNGFVKGITDEFDLIVDKEVISSGEINFKEND